MFKDIRKRMSKTLEKKALPPLPSQRPQQQQQQQQQQQKKGGTSPSPSSPSLNTKKYTHRTSSTSTASLSITSTPASPTTPQRAVSAASLMSIGSDPLLDHSHLKPGDNASLLSYSQTINMYRENAKKSNNADIQCDFAIFLVEAAKRLEQQQEERQEEEDDDEDDNNDSDQDRIQQGGQIKQQDMRQAYLTEAEKLLKVASLRGHRESQHYLANMYAAGLLCKDGRPDFDKAFPLFVQAAKHHDPDAAFRTGKCYEDGLGTRRDRTKAAQYYKKAASLNHPGAMYRLGLAEMNGELGMTRNLRDGHKWLKRSAEAATPQYPHALHELALLHEKGFDSVIFVDTTYAVHLYSEAAALGYAPSAFRLGECYEFGRLGCTKDASLSIRYYSIAADQGHPDACFALAAWYLMGAQDVLEASEQQAFAWAYRAALQGLPKAEYAIGYFYEVGIGVAADAQEAVAWYERAAAQGERRAAKRLHQMPARYRSSYTATQTNKAIPARLPSALQLHGEELLQRAKGLLSSKKESGPIANFV